MTEYEQYNSGSKEADTNYSKENLNYSLWGLQYFMLHTESTGTYIFNFKILERETLKI
jgi:hypothetical protein